MSSSKVSSADFSSFHNVIDGKLVGSKEQHHGTNPSTGEELWPVAVASEEDVNNAVTTARKAFNSWRNVPVQERRQALCAWANKLVEHKDELTDILCKEVGRPKQFSAMEVDIVKGIIDTISALELPVERIEDDIKILTTRYVPLGVAVAIAPFNYPLILSLNKVASALITGCTVIVKPSPYTPYSTLKCVELAQEFFPPGVMQALGGTETLGPMLVAHPGVDKIAFTGSIATGKKIAAVCAKTMKRVTLELGGNDVCIVLPDVNIAKVAPEVVLGALSNSGQFCVASKRVLIPEEIFRPFVDAMIGFTAYLKPGHPEDPSSGLGPVQNKMQYDRVIGFVDDCRKNGYKFATGDETVKQGKGFFVQPTIIENPPLDSRIVQEEPFGPIFPVIPYKTVEEAIEIGNNSNCGLGACVWGKDVEQAESVGRQLEAGTVWVNSWPKPDPRGYFSGFKESGIGGDNGVQGLMEYCQAQCMHTWKTEM